MINQEEKFVWKFLLAMCQDRQYSNFEVPLVHLVAFFVSKIIADLASGGVVTAHA